MNFPSSHQCIIKVQLFLDSEAVVVSWLAQNSSFKLPWQCFMPHIDFSMDRFAAYAHLLSVDVQVQ